MSARLLCLAGLFIAATCGAAACSGNQTNSLPGGGTDGTGGSDGGGGGGDDGGGGDAARNNGGSTCAGCNDPAPQQTGDAGQDPTPPQNPQYMEVCSPSQTPPVQGNCPSGLTCINFDDHGTVCSHACTVVGDCAAPSVECAASKSTAKATFCVPPLK